MRLFGVYFQLVTVETQKNVGGKERNAFVTVDKRMVHDERFEKGCCHTGEIFVITGPGTVQGAFQQAEIAHSCQPPKAFQQGTVDFQNFVATEKGNGFTLQAAFQVLRFRS